MKKTLLSILLIGALLIVGCTSNSATGEATQTIPTQDSELDETIVVPEVRTFVVTGQDFTFITDGVEAPEIRVNKGDTVRIEFTSVQGYHDWVVDEFSAATEKVRDGGSTSVEFVADKEGTFEYYCSVGEHRANGMVGKLIVE